MKLGIFPFHVTRRGQYRGKSSVSFVKPKQIQIKSMSLTNSKFRLSKRQILIAGSVFAVLPSFGPTLNPRQEAIIFGNVLGDGHIQLSANTQSARLRFNHSMKQADYVKWQYKNLEWLCEGVSEPKQIIEKQKYKVCRGYTAYKSQLKPYHSLAYRQATAKEPGRRFIKVIPENFGEYLKDPEALMVWYLDDGTLRLDGGACRLATQGFTLDENMILQDCLKQNFDVITKVERWPNNQPGLFIPSRGGHAANFVNLFSKTVENEIPSMTYKVRRYL